MNCCNSYLTGKFLFLILQSVSIAADAENEIVSRLQKVELENQELRSGKNQETCLI